MCNGVRPNLGNNILYKSHPISYSCSIMSKKKEPKTLQEAVVYFADPDNALNYLRTRRWPDGVAVCPTCGRDDVTFLAKQRKWQCKSRHKTRMFSIKVGTIFEGSPIGLDKWLCAIWMLTNCKNGVSSYETARDLGVTQKTAWFMLQRIRLAMQDEDDGGTLGGEVEVDETFIGGKARNMHKDKRAKKITGTGGKDKAIVFGMLERGGRAKATVVDRRNREALHGEIRKHVRAGSSIFSDELKSYNGLATDYEHSVINHAVEYANGNVHTNGIENFWSLLKRGIRGTYVSVEPFHLYRYLDEQCFRFNFRKDWNDVERFDIVLGNVSNKRLTYAQLTGKSEDRQTTIPA